MHQNIVQAFIQCAERHSNFIAIDAEDRQLPYQQLHAESDSIAKIPLERGVGTFHMVKFSGGHFFIDDLYVEICQDIVDSLASESVVLTV